MASFLSYLSLVGQLLALILVGPIINIANWFGFLWKSQKDVSKDIVLITGAGSGIGRLMALKFAALGSSLVLWDINRAAVEQVVAEIKAAGQNKVVSYQVNVSDREQVYSVAKKVKQEVGSVTILINNAGIVTGKSLLDCPDHLIDKTMHVNTISHFWTLKAFLPDMISSKRGHIVTVASIAGWLAGAGVADYITSKFGAVGLSESLRLEIKKLQLNDIHTTCICPYVIDTGMFDGAHIKYPLLFPMLKADYVANEAVFAIRANEELAVIPKTLHVGFLFRAILPVSIFDRVTDLLGSNELMSTFQGRATK